MDKKIIEKDIKTYKSLEILAESDGGKILINTLYKDLGNIVDTLSVNAAKLSHIEMVYLCSSIGDKLNIIRTLSKAKLNADMAETALKEMIEAEKEEST